MRRPVIAGNWKMHKTTRETADFIHAFRPLVEGARAEVLLCPPYTALATAVDLCRGTNIAVGAQNLHWEEQGAYTGEISPVMLKELGITHCIIGHSERRQYFAETGATVNKKVKAALHHGLTPIVCVGESLAERERGVTQEVVRRQVQEGLAGLTPEEAARLIIAYEPIWAIGTGKTASAADAQEVIRFIRQVLGEMCGGEAAEQVRILYGGSVKPENIKELMAQPDIDGALVGGASLKAESFAQIVNFE